MADRNEHNVAGLYTGDSIDDISVTLHSNSGWPVVWHVWEDGNWQFHVFAEADPDTEDFLMDTAPNQIDEYHRMVETIPTANSQWLSLINSFIAAGTYNSIRPIIEDEDNWLELNEEELDRD